MQEGAASTKEESLYLKFLKSCWQKVWIEWRFFGLRSPNDSDSIRGFKTWFAWWLFWLALPAIVVGLLFGILLLVHAPWVALCGLPAIMWGLHCWAVWGATHTAMRGVVDDPSQHSWISATGGSIALISASLVGLSVIAVAWFSIGWSFTLFELSPAPIGDQVEPEQKKIVEQEAGVDEEEPETRQNSDPPVSASKPEISLVENDFGLPIWWLTGDSKHPVVGMDRNPLEPDQFWRLSDICRQGVLIVITSASADGFREYNIRLSQDRAVRLSKILVDQQSECQAADRPSVVMISLGQIERPKPDGWQRRSLIAHVANKEVLRGNQIGMFLSGDIVTGVLQMEIDEFPDAQACEYVAARECSWTSLTHTGNTP